MNTAAITAQIDTKTLALVDAAAAARGLSREAFAAEAIQRVAENEADFAAFLQEGIDAANRGEVIPHDEILAEIQDMIAKHRAR